MKTKEIEFTRIKNDVNGNPRYVCHFTVFNKMGTTANSIEESYANAIKLANKIGGRKYHNKQFGGGIVFQSYNTIELNRRIVELVKTGK